MHRVYLSMYDSLHLVQLSSDILDTGLAGHPINEDVDDLRHQARGELARHLVHLNGNFAAVQYFSVERDHGLGLLQTDNYVDHPSYLLHLGLDEVHTPTTCHSLNPHPCLGPHLNMFMKIVQQQKIFTSLT